MKKTLLIGLCMMLLLVGLVAASDYYLNDTNNGGNESSTTCTSANPCAALSQLPSLTYGDNVYLARGSIFRGAYYNARDDVDYTSYGNSALSKPKIYGSVNLSSTGNWTSLGGNLWRSPHSMQSFSTSISLDLNASYYNTSSNPTLMPYDDTPDSNWEFSYNETNKSITVYLDSGNPATYANGIEVPVYYRNTTGYPLIHMATDDNVTFTDIEVAYTIQGGIYFYDCTNMVINGVDMKYTYQKGISYSVGDNNVLKNSTCTYCGTRGMDSPYGLGGQGENFWIQQETDFYVFNNTLQNGGGVIINLWHNGNGTIERNTIKNCNQSSTEWAGGIYVDGGDNTKIHNNTIINCNGGVNIGTEYVGYYSDNNVISYNKIYRTRVYSIMVGADGIGNYSVATNTNISHNSIYDDVYVSGSGYGNQIFLSEFNNLSFKDNIISTNYSDSEGDLLYWYNSTPHTRAFTSDNNLWYSSTGRYYYDVSTTTYTSLSSFQSAKNQDLNSLIGNPLYSDIDNYNFTPQYSSLACGQASDGTDIGAVSCQSTPSSSLVLYIDNGNDNCSNSYTRGQASNPNQSWCSLSVLETEDNLANGDIVYIREGSYNSESAVDLYFGSITTNWSLKGYPGEEVNISNYNEDYAVEDNGLWTNISNATYPNTWRTTMVGLISDNPIVQFSNGTEFINTENDCWSLTGCSTTDSNYVPFNHYTDWYRVWANESSNDLRVMMAGGENPNNVSLFIADEYSSVLLNNFNGTGNLTVSGLNFKNHRRGMTFDNCSNVLFENNSATEGIACIRFRLSDNYPDKTVTIRNNIFSGTHPRFYQEFVKNAYEESDCISTDNSAKQRFIVYNNYFDSVAGGVSITNDEPDAGCGSHIYNNLFNASDYGNYESVLEIEQYCCNSTWENNTIIGGFMGISLGGANSTTNKCTLKDNKVILDHYIIFDNDTSYETYPIKAYYASTNVVNWNISHNTLFGYGKGWYGIDNGGHNRSIFNTSVMNNIFVANSSTTMIYRTGEDADGNYWNYNLYYDYTGSEGYTYWMNNTKSTVYSSLTSAKLSSSWDGEWDNMSIEDDPLFTDLSSYDVSLSSSSPACDAASDGSAIGAEDCTATSSVPVVNILSSPNGTITSDTTPIIRFNFTDDDSTTANCTLRGNYYQEDSDYREAIAWYPGSGGWFSYDEPSWFNGVWDDPYFNSSLEYLTYEQISYDKFNNPSGAIWTIQNGAGIYNYSVNQSCFDYEEGNLSFALQNTHSTNTGYWDCWSGVYDRVRFDWNHDVHIAEEALWWIDIKSGNNASTQNYTATNLTSNSLDNGVYYLYVSCVDGSGNVGNSSQITFTVDSETPEINIFVPVDGSSTSSNVMNISYELLHETAESPLSYFNISLYDSGAVFNRTIQGNNSVNTSYLWTGVLDELYSPGTYYVKVTAFDSSGDVIATESSSFIIVTDATLNITAVGNGVALSNFTITLSPGNSTVTTSGSVVVGIFKNFTYNVTISDSGFASTGVSMNWSNDTNYLLFNLTALANSVYITFKDFDNLSLSSGFNINLEYIGSSLSGNKTTSTGYMNISGLSIGDYTLRYGATGFETRFYSVSIFDESTQNITLYMIPSSSASNVTVTVIDQNANPIQNAVVKALKYDLASNSYLLQEIASTDINGRVIMSLSMYDEYYKFMVEYDGVLKVTTSPSYITSNSLTIQILIGELVGQDYYHYANLYADLTFNTVTNNFRLDYDDVDGIVDNVCLEVFTLGLLGQVPFNSSCSTSASGTLLVLVDAVNGTTYLAKVYYYDDGDKIFLISKTYTYPSGEIFGKTFGLLLQVVLTVFCAFIAVWSIPLAAILVPLSLVIGKLLQFNFFGWDAISAIIVVGFIIAYVTRKNNG